MLDHDDAFEAELRAGADDYSESLELDRQAFAAEEWVVWSCLATASAMLDALNTFLRSKHEVFEYGGRSGPASILQIFFSVHENMVRRQGGPTAGVSIRGLRRRIETLLGDPGAVHRKAERLVEHGLIIHNAEDDEYDTTEEGQALHQQILADYLPLLRAIGRPDSVRGEDVLATSKVLRAMRDQLRLASDGDARSG